MSRWTERDAKPRFSELLEITLTTAKEPQVVTKRGVEAAVMVPIEQWRKLQESIRRSPIDVLVGEGSRFDLPLPERDQASWRMDRMEAFNPFK